MLLYTATLLALRSIEIQHLSPNILDIYYK